MVRERQTTPGGTHARQGPGHRGSLYRIIEPASALDPGVVDAPPGRSVDQGRGLCGPERTLPIPLRPDASRRTGIVCRSSPTVVGSAHRRSPGPPRFTIRSAINGETTYGGRPGVGRRLLKSCPERGFKFFPFVAREGEDVHAHTLERNWEKNEGGKPRPRTRSHALLSAAGTAPCP